MDGHSPSGAPIWMSSQISSIRLGVSRVTARLLTSIAGPWSHIPVQEVRSTLTAPSAETWPRRSFRRLSMWSNSAALPSIRSVMLSENRTR